ncbi:MAG: c-type cytochrome, partial [Acidobacteriota bacterium]|nr:c-type cytochrome [Acidobacteriota bacterium]
MRWPLLLLSVLVCSAQTKPAIEESARTILDKNCAGCHGAAQMSGLDLREREAALRGGKRGPALVPGKAAQSLIYSAIARTGELAMPPGKKTLSTAEIETIREWIDAGAKWPASPASSESAWWSFRKLQRPDVPKNAAAKPIDAFILAKLDEKGMRP